jgi:hypothetical protein
MSLGLRAVGAAIVFGLSFTASAMPAAAVTLASDSRLTLPDFARKHGEDVGVYETRYAATGIVNCGGTYSTAQLTVSNDIVTTAAHAFYGPSGSPRGGDLSACVFTIDIKGATYTARVRGDTVRAGSTTPYALPPVHDWAVARLDHPIPQARPYAIDGSSATGTSIMLLAHRHRGWAHDGSKAIEDCSIRAAQLVDSGSPREIDIDCSAGDGASGSAIMLQGSAAPKMVGIYVGWRSAHPDLAGPYSPTHMNFGVAVEGPFRTAIIETAQQTLIGRTLRAGFGSGH